MKRLNSKSGCAVEVTLSVMGGTWKPIILFQLLHGKKRFGELSRAIPGITQRMLTLTLRGLERDGLVSRTPLPTNPPTVEYALTARGQSLLVPLMALAQWGNDHRQDIECSRDAYDRAQAARAAQEPPPGVHRIAARLDELSRLFSGGDTTLSAAVRTAWREDPGALSGDPAAPADAWAALRAFLDRARQVSR